MRILPLLLTLIMTLTPAASALAQDNAAIAPEQSLSQQAQAAFTEEQLAEAALFIAAMDAAYADAPVEDKGFFEYFPLNLIAPSDWRTTLNYVLCSYLSLNDGANLGAVLMIQLPLAAEVTLLGMAFQPDDVMKEDAMRHYLWTHRSASITNYEAARIHTVNNEFCSILTGRTLDYLDVRFIELRREGQRWVEAFVNALQDTGAYAIEQRDIIFAAESFEVWNAYYSGYDIQDLWNNNVGLTDGRDAVGLWNNSLIKGMMLFNEHWDAGDLIKDITDEEASLERRRIIYENPILWKP